MKNLPRLIDEVGMSGALYPENRAGYDESAAHTCKLDRALVFDDLKNATVLPAIPVQGRNAHIGGVIDEAGCFIENSAFKRTNVMMSGYEPCDTHFEDKFAIYIGPIWNHYGHWLMDNCTRLWHVAKYGLGDKYLVFIGGLFGSDRLQEYEYEFMELLGIPRDRVLFITKPTKFRRLIVPKPSCEMDSFWTEEFKLIFDKIRDNVPAASYERVYFSRRKFDRNVSFGEEKLEHAARKAGFKVFHPERLSVKKQVALIKGAKIFMSLSGTVAHNLIFAGEDTRAIILNRSNGVVFNQIMVNKIAGVKCAFVDVYDRSLPTAHSGDVSLIGCNENFKKLFPTARGKGTPGPYLHRWLKTSMTNLRAIEMMEKMNAAEVFAAMRKFIEVNKLKEWI